jgi:hypothetical protein
MNLVGVSLESASILLSVFVLAALTATMMLWMYATRLPAMGRAGLDPQMGAHVTDLRGKLPASAERVADNYNHLTEAPTVFYAVALGIVVLGAAEPVDVACAWAYVGLRIVHSLVQATINRVVLRFALFSLSWVVLIVLIGRAILATIAMCKAVC